MALEDNKFLEDVLEIPQDAEEAKKPQDTPKKPQDAPNKPNELYIAPSDTVPMPPGVQIPEIMKEPEVPLALTKPKGKPQHIPEVGVATLPLPQDTEVNKIQDTEGSGIRRLPKEPRKPNQLYIAPSYPSEDYLPRSPEVLPPDIMDAQPIERHLALTKPAPQEAAPGEQYVPRNDEDSRLLRDNKLFEMEEINTQDIPSRDKKYEILEQTNSVNIQLDEFKKHMEGLEANVHKFEIVESKQNLLLKRKYRYERDKIYNEYNKIDWKQDILSPVP